MATWSPDQVVLIRQHLASMSGHALFTKAERLAHFLSCIVEAELKGESNTLNQNTIAIDVFERGADFDPAADSIVRVEAGRLRAKLREYYETVEDNGEIRIELPKGSYAPRIHIVSRVSSETSRAIKAAPGASKNNALPLIAGAVVFFIAVIAYLLLEPVETSLISTSEISSEITAVQSQDAKPVSVVLNNTPSIAVLPFVNIGGDPEQEYFSDGVAEEILNALSQVPDLRVAARTSSFYFKGEKIDLQTIADKLNVNHVLEGSVRKSGNRIRITAKLIRTDNGFQLWSESYNRELVDIFTIQDEVANAVVKKLEVSLASATDNLVRIGTTDLNAYNWFLRGKDQITNGTPESLDLAVQYFQRAIEIDRNYADAYGYLAYSYIRMNLFIGYGELAVRVEEAYQHALALDPELSVALVAKAYHTLRTEWDWQKMYSLLQSAKPNDAFNDAWLSMYAEHYLWPLGRIDEGIQLLRRAERSDPFSVEVKYQLGWFLTYKEMYGEALTKFKEALEFAPDSMWTLAGILELYIYTDDFENAENTMYRLGQQDNQAVQPFLSGFSIELSAARGELKQARSKLEDTIQLVEKDKSLSREFWPNLALSAVSLGDDELAIKLFQRAYDDQSNAAHWLRSWTTQTPYFELNSSKLLEHPDFKAF